MKIKLVVHSNPYAALDHLGRAQCAVYHPGSTAIVGGYFDHEAFEASKKESPSGEGKHRFVFSDAPVELECSVPDFAYFRNRVLEGALIAGDAATARKCGVAFVDPKKALEAAHDAAVAKFRSDYGIDPLCVAARHLKPAAKTAAKE